jgi:hypothetical protein
MVSLWLSFKLCPQRIWKKFLFTRIISILPVRLLTFWQGSSHLTSGHPCLHDLCIVGWPPSWLGHFQHHALIFNTCGHTLTCKTTHPLQTNMLTVWHRVAMDNVFRYPHCLPRHLAWTISRSFPICMASLKLTFSPFPKHFWPGTWLFTQIGTPLIRWRRRFTRTSLPPSTLI